MLYRHLQTDEITYKPLAYNLSIIQVFVLNLLQNSERN